MKKSLSSLICMVMGIVCCISMLAVGIAAAKNFQAQFAISLSFTNPNLICKIGLAITGETGQVGEQIIFNNTTTPVVANPANPIIITLNPTIFGTPTSDNNFVFTFYNYDSASAIIATCDVSGVITGTSTDNLLGYTITNSASSTESNRANSTPTISIPTLTPTYDSETLTVNVQAHTAGTLTFDITISEA